MLKKIWNRYSYAIVLLGLSLLSTIILVTNIHNSANNEYIKVTVNEGESLWEISENYAKQHDLSTVDFIKWVEKNNAIAGDTIHPGDELLIPVTQESNTSTTDVASSVEEIE